MTHNEFNYIISSINALSPDQMRQLYRELESRMAATKQPAPALAGAGHDAEETAFDVASRAGLIGCIEGAPRSPTDLSTNPKHMEGFGRE
jgi:hypothetical protein